ncbi:hypothetical protein Tco_0810315 [Tanacetum coccineum]
MNKLYETFVPQVELSLEQKYFSEASTSNVTHVIENVSNSSSPPLEMPKPSKLQKYFQNLEAEIKILKKLVVANISIGGVAYVDREDSILRIFCYKESMESELCETLKQNELLNDRLLEATLTHDVEKCVLIHSESKNDNLNVEIEKVKSESKDVQENLLKRIKIIENDF